MRQRSTTDALTGLLNRATFDEEAATLIEQADGRPVCAIIFDIDHFKTINDNCGHPVGDRVIARLGQLLAGSTLLHCIAGRIGGEEFAVLLAGSDAATARLFAEAVRTGFSASDHGEDLPWTVTLSAGLAQRQSGESLTSLIARADKALYAAKAAGRDRVMLDEQLPGRRMRMA